MATDATETAYFFALLGKAEATSGAGGALYRRPIGMLSREYGGCTQIDIKWSGPNGSTARWRIWDVAAGTVVSSTDASSSASTVYTKSFTGLDSAKIYRIEFGGSSLTGPGIAADGTNAVVLTGPTTFTKRSSRFDPNIDAGMVNNRAGVENPSGSSQDAQYGTGRTPQIMRPILGAGTNATPTFGPDRLMRRGTGMAWVFTGGARIAMPVFNSAESGNVGLIRYRGKGSASKRLNGNVAEADYDASPADADYPYWSFDDVAIFRLDYTDGQAVTSDPLQCDFVMLNTCLAGMLNIGIVSGGLSTSGSIGAGTLPDEPDYWDVHGDSNQTEEFTGGDPFPPVPHLRTSIVTNYVFRAAERHGLRACMAFTQSGSYARDQTTGNVDNDAPKITTDAVPIYNALITAGGKTPTLMSEGWGTNDGIPDGESGTINTQLKAGLTTAFNNLWGITGRSAVPLLSLSCFAFNDVGTVTEANFTQNYNAKQTLWTTTFAAKTVRLVNGHTMVPSTGLHMFWYDGAMAQAGRRFAREAGQLLGRTTTPSVSVSGTIDSAGTLLEVPFNEKLFDNVGTWTMAGYTLSNVRLYGDGTMAQGGGQMEGGKYLRADISPPVPQGATLPPLVYTQAGSEPLATATGIALPASSSVPLTNNSTVNNVRPRVRMSGGMRELTGGMVG